MPATMKALRKMQAGKGLQIEKAQVPSIGPTEVLVRAHQAARDAGPRVLRGGGKGGRRSDRGARWGFCQRGNAPELRALTPMPAGAGAHLPESEDYRDRSGWRVRGVRKDSGNEYLEA